MMQTIRIILFDDSQQIRESLELLFSSAPGFELSGSFPNATESLNQVEVYKPDVVLMDIDMPEVNGLDAVSVLHQSFPKIPVIMLTVFDDEERVFRALSNGAMGYLLKNISPTKLLEAISEVYHGGAPMTPSIARKVMLHFQKTAASKVATEDYHLALREREVLTLLTEGLSYKMIASRMNISMETVKTYMKRIYEKLHVTCMTEAVAKAIHQRLV
ncbi:MAG TPA: response regulator transcription factor [Chitinophagales bacterium]|nr:response regulator transcription factor [Chitinophagales bacterium]